MECNGHQAQEIYDRLPTFLRAPEHSPEYIIADATRDNSLRPTFFVFQENEQVYYHAFHVSPIAETNFFDIQSPYGYGGPISTTNEKGFLNRAWSEYCNWCKQANILAEFVRFHPLLKNYQYYNGTVEYNRDTVFADLTVTDLLKSCATRVRTAIRKGISNQIEFQWSVADDFAMIFPSLYRENMAQVSASEFYFFDDVYFEKLMKVSNSKLAICKFEGEVVAGAIFLSNGKYLEYHLSAMNVIGRRLAAMNVLLYQTMLWGKEAGFEMLHFGGGTDASPDNPLLFFKKGFSSHLTNYYIGYYLHNEAQYNNLKSEWKKKGECINEKILFYRG